MKICTQCGQEKPTSEFAWKNKAAGRLSPRCKECHREYSKAHYQNNREYYIEKTAKSRYRGSAYGLSRDEAAELIARNEGLCEICNDRVATHIDHDHVTGTVRGHLCAACNVGLGTFRDDISLLNAAIEYLKR